MGLVSPSKELPIGTVLIFSFGASAPAPCALSRVPFRGLIIPEEPLGGYIPLCLTGAISQEPLPPFCRPGACSLPDGEWLLPCLAERPPTTRREVFAFDKRVSRCVSCVGHFGDPGTERWSFWRLSEGGSVATISFGIGIRAFVRPSWSPEFFRWGERSDASPSRSLDQPSGSGGQCASQPSLLPRTFAVLCLCHGPHIAFCHSRSLLAQHRTTPVVCACVCPCV